MRLETRRYQVYICPKCGPCQLTQHDGRGDDRCGLCLGPVELGWVDAKPTSCQICTVYEATSSVTVGKLTVALCRACIPRLRAAWKEEYKRVEAAVEASRVCHGCLADRGDPRQTYPDTPDKPCKRHRDGWTDVDRMEVQR